MFPKTVEIYLYHRSSDIKGLDKTMETAGNLKHIYSNMVFWSHPSREIRVYAVPLQLMRNLVSRDGH